MYTIAAADGALQSTLAVFQSDGDTIDLGLYPQVPALAYPFPGLFQVMNLAQPGLGYGVGLLAWAGLIGVSTRLAVALLPVLQTQSRLVIDVIADQ